MHSYFVFRAAERLSFEGATRNKDYLLRILLDSGFGAKCGAPHFAPLLPNTQYGFSGAGAASGMSFHWLV